MPNLLSAELIGAAVNVMDLGAIFRLDMGFHMDERREKKSQNLYGSFPKLGSYFGFLHEGSCCFGSILDAPDFLKLAYRDDKL